MSRTDSAAVAQRTEHLAQVLAQPDSGSTRGGPIAKWLLGAELAEISGLALTADGRLLTHADEGGRVFEIDYRSGRMVGHFKLGKELVKADFEGITRVKDTFYLLASNGTLYQFQQVENGERAAYTVHDTGLKHECEFEGVAFDSTIHSLLLACKNVRTAGPLQDSLVIYRWKLPQGSEPRTSRLTVPLTLIIGANGWKGLHPSDITIDPLSGNYVLVAAQENALIEITPSGDLIFARPLPPGLDHAEGVAITKDSILIISTEARQNLRAAVTLYRWP
jgi:uncharacterized protein YjiK